MARNIEEPTRTAQEGYGRDGEVKETHPAFGVAVVGRMSGTPRALFQSDVLHSESITLSIRTADRTRGLSHDWVHPGKTLVEVEMSLAQWGAVVSSVGVGSGVPVTVRATEGVHLVPELPYQPRIKANLDEVNAAVDKLMEKVRVTLEALTSAIEGKAGVKVVREAMRDHAAAVEHAEANSVFAVKSMVAAGEKVTSQVRADIESQILAAARLTDRGAISAPTMHFGEIEEGKN